MLNKKMIELMERNIKYIYYSYVISIMYINLLNLLSIKLYILLGVHIEDVHTNFVQRKQCSNMHFVIRNHKMEQHLNVAFAVI